VVRQLPCSHPGCVSVCACERMFVSIMSNSLTIAREEQNHQSDKKH
jgi:hypothetical protein